MAFDPAIGKTVVVVDQRVAVDSPAVAETADEARDEAAERAALMLRRLDRDSDGYVSQREARSAESVVRSYRLGS
jgi:hypothetical protein